MGIAAALGAVGAIGSIASSASSLFGGGGGGGSVPQPTQLPDQKQEATNYRDIVAQMQAFGQNLPQQLYPQYQQQAGQLTNNPYAAPAQGGANLAAGATPQVTNMQLGGAQTAFNQGQGFSPYINQALQTGFDPQQALYAQQRQGTLDSANAINAQSGLGGTPYAASLDQNALNNFNINWQNNLLNREQTGAQTASGLNQSQGLDFATANQLGTGALGTLVSGFGSPYATSTGQAQTGLGGLNSLTNASTAVFGLPQQTLQDLQSYLNLGQSASGLALQGQQQQFNQNQVLGSQLATSLSNPALSNSLNGLFGGGSPYGNSAVAYGGSSYNPASTYGYIDQSGTGYGAY